MADVDPRYARRRYSRRQVVGGGTALGLSLAALGSASRRAGVFAQDATIELFHDKANWNDYYNEMGELAMSAVGVKVEGVPYSDTTTYQQTIL